MALNSGPRLRPRLLLAWLLLPLLSAGCASPWWNSFLDPSQVGNFRESNIVNEIQQTISFRDTPPGVAGATDPTPEDLVQTVEEYTIGVADQLSIRLLDFVMRDVESEFQPVVNDLGYIDLPQLGDIYVEGMTARMLRSEIIQRAKAAGIYRQDSEPTVVISFLIQQQRVYNISGAIQTPGRFRILPPDFRLRDAINQAGGLDPSVKTIYVFRNTPKPKRVVNRGGYQAAPTTIPAIDAPTPPVGPVSMSAGSAGPVALPAVSATLAQTPAPAPPPTAPAAPNPEDELIEALEPAPPAETPAPADAAAPAPAQVAQATPADASAATAPSGAPFIFVNDRFIPADQQPAETPAAPAPAAEAGTGAVATPTSPEAAVDWEELASEGQQRIIRVPAEKILNGDPNYNIVIKHDDWIRLDSGHVGVIYVFGHVVRPGTYSITGQEMTLKQAIAAAGGLDQLAWPTRCEIVRRIDRDREEITQWNLERIMAGLDPDLFLKPEDMINVGTHAVAPLLATIRNAFRLTYGFGFVYDRNFADIDSFQPRTNPRERRRAEIAQRFPGLFP